MGAAQRAHELHDWDLEPKDAIEVQKNLRGRLRLRWDSPEPARVAGVDVHYDGGRPRAAICVFTFPELEPLESVTATVDHEYPYVPGLLAFREGPAVLAAWDRLRSDPDLVLFDAHGIAHPRRLGLASLLGLWLQRPTIGVAKSRLCGKYEQPGPQRGAWEPLRAERQPTEVIGAVLRTRGDVRSVFVSPGNLIDLETSVRLTLACCTRYRLPKPTRWAHRVADGAEFNPPSKSS